MIRITNNSIEFVSPFDLKIGECYEIWEQYHYFPGNFEIMCKFIRYIRVKDIDKNGVIYFTEPNDPESKTIFQHDPSNVELSERHIFVRYKNGGRHYYGRTV